jgi:ligand-binding sensor domain-containing protein
MQIKQLIFFLSFFTINFSEIQAQPREFIVSKYEEIDGINTKSVSDLLQGKEGYLWLATYQGLVRFDSYVFKRFTNKPGFSNSINKIAQDKKGNIWMAMSDGTLAKFNPSTAEFTNTSIHFLNRQQTESPGSAECLFLDSEDNLWMGITRTGLVKINTENGNAEVFNVVQLNDRFFAPEIKKFYNRVLGIFEDEQKLFWLATPDGLYTFNKISKQMKQISKRPASASDFRNENYRTITKIGNKLWIGSWGSGLHSYNLVTGNLEIFKFNNEKSADYTTNIIHSLVVKNDSIILIASPDKGFLEFNTRTKIYTAISGSSLHKNIPLYLWTKLLFDKDHNIWALNEVGLMKIQVPDYKFQFQNFPVKHSDNGIFYELYDVWEDADIRIVCTGFAEGVYVFNKKNGSKKVLPVELLKGEEKIMQIPKITQDKNGIIWLCSRDYIYQYNKQTEQLIKVNQPAQNVEANSNVYNDITADKNGNLWIGSTRNGLFKYDIKHNQYEHFFLNAELKYKIPVNFISAAAADIMGRVWFASNRGFLSYYDPVTSTIQTSEKINSILTGLYEKKVYDLFIDSRSNLWASTATGLVKIDCANNIPKYLKTFTTENGLQSESVIGLTEDINGNIWGIEKLIYSVCKIDANTSKLWHYGLRDGINKPGDMFRLVKTNNANIWLLAQGGYYEFNTAIEDVRQKQQPLAITIMAVNSMDKYFEDEIKQNGKILLEPNENSFYFEFAAIDFSRPEIYQYAYMLEGFDTGWIYCGSRRGVSYTNIPGGNYLFKVKATSVKGEWSSSILKIPFKIRIPFYRMWWFILATLILLVTGIYNFYLFRIKKQRQILLFETKTQTLEKEKTQVQYENLKQHLNPHFLFNSLTSLGSLIRVDQKMAGDFLDSMSKIYRYILQSKDKDIVNLKDEMKFVGTFIHLQKTRFNEGLIVHINVPEEFNYRKIVPVALQNLIENAIKHNIIDDESPLVINIFIEEDYLVVKNNLQKKKFVETSNQQGLDNLSSLYKYLSDRPLLTEENNQSFIVKIPLI